MRTSTSLLCLVAFAGCAAPWPGSEAPPAGPRAPTSDRAPTPAAAPPPPSSPPSATTPPVSPLRPAAAPVMPQAGAPPKRGCYLDFLDMGTGLAVAGRCTSADGKKRWTFLYDGGSRDPSVKNKGRLVDLLTKIGLPKGTVIDHVFLSHPHEDHSSDLGGPPNLLANYDVKHLWDSAAINTSGQRTVCRFLKDVITRVNAKKTQYHAAKRCPDFARLKCVGNKKTDLINTNKELKPFLAQVKYYAPPSRANASKSPFKLTASTLLNGVEATIYHADPAAPGSDLNEASLVLGLDLFGVRILLTGDEEAGRSDLPGVAAKPKSVEKFLVDKGWIAGKGAATGVHIVGVPHHGSNTSSSQDFQDDTLAYTAKKELDTVAIISSGPYPYGRRRVQLPIPAIQTAWEKTLGGKARVFSTKLDDAGACKTDPADCNNVEITIETEPRKRRAFVTSVVSWPNGPRLDPAR